MIRNRYMRQHVVHVPISRNQCNDRLGVEMNTEQFIIIPDNAVHDVRNQATKVRRDHSFR